ncbi:MAG: pyridoxal phosphate enzyme (YggS family) [Verrucomicrobiales bacterium]|jgi:pyridoxal phosphate enzyme (YggS family)
MPNFRQNYEEVSKKIACACARAGRPAGSASLLVVSKRWPSDTIQEVVDCGNKLFGESRIQEAEEKLPKLPADLDWHFIGHIQKNKVRKILPLFPTLHSIDSNSLARRVDQIAGDLGLHPRVFLQVNIASEESKHGFSPDDLRSEIGELLTLPHIHVVGLMAIPPAVDKPEDSRGAFREVAALQAELAEANDAALPELSMGMSGDYEVAIEEGSTIVRVGSSIFGQRQST